MSPEKQSKLADNLIATHTTYATVAGMIPIPIVDFTAVSAVHTDMLRGLAKIYDVQYDENSGKNLAAAVIGTAIARIGSSVIKAIPGVGAILGGLSSVAISAATTYALGHTFKKHFESGGNLLNVNTETLKNIFKQELKKGKKVAEEMKTNPTEDAGGMKSSETVFHLIERLSVLRDKGVITEEDFESQKQKLLDQL